MHVFSGKTSKKKLAKFKERTQERNDLDRHNRFLLQAWDAALNGPGSDLKLIHCISSRGSVSAIGRMNTDSPFLTRTVDSLLSSWDVISTSCVGRKAKADGSVTGAAPLDIHLNLIVPVQIIIGTHLRDVRFNNHAGLEGNRPGGRVIDKGALSRDIFMGISRPNNHGFRMNERYDILRHPDEFRTSQLSPSCKYNEILIIGRPGVALYMGFPCSQAVKLRSISFRPNYLTAIASTGRYTEQFVIKFREDLEFIKKILRVNSINEIIFSLGQLEAVRRLDLSYHFEMAGFRKQSETVYILN